MPSPQVQVSQPFAHLGPRAAGSLDAHSGRRGGRPRLQQRRRPGGGAGAGSGTETPCTRPGPAAVGRLRLRVRGAHARSHAGTGAGSPRQQRRGPRTQLRPRPVSAPLPLLPAPEHHPPRGSGSPGRGGSRRPRAPRPSDRPPAAPPAPSRAGVWTEQKSGAEQTPEQLRGASRLRFRQRRERPARRVPSPQLPGIVGPRARPPTRPRSLGPERGWERAARGAGGAGGGDTATRPRSPRPGGAAAGQRPRPRPRRPIPEPRAARGGRAGHATGRRGDRAVVPVAAAARAAAARAARRARSWPAVGAWRPPLSLGLRRRAAPAPSPLTSHLSPPAPPRPALRAWPGARMRSRARRSTRAPPGGGRGGPVGGRGGPVGDLEPRPEAPGARAQRCGSEGRSAHTQEPESCCSALQALGVVLPGLPPPPSPPACGNG